MDNKSRLSKDDKRNQASPQEREGAVTTREHTATLREGAANVREVAVGRREETSAHREDAATLREDAASVREEAEQEDLRDSRVMLAQTGRLAKVGGWQLDVNTQIFSWTEEVCAIHEVDPATTPTVADAIQFYAPESRPVIAAAVQAAINAGTSFDLELPLLTARGRHIWVRTLGIAERLDGKTSRVHGAFQDITVRKQAEEALRANERLLSESQRLGHVGSWFWDLTGPFLWSEETYRIYGVSPQRFTPTPESVLGLIHPDDRAAMQAWLATLKAGEVHDLEFRTTTPDGTVRSLLGRGETVEGAGNSLAHMAGTVQDITERKQAEEVLRTSENLYRSLFDQMAEGCAYCEMIFQNGEPQDFIHLAVNPAFETLTGLRNVTGKRVSEVLPGIRETDPQLFVMYGRVSFTGTPEKCEIFVNALQRWFGLSVGCPVKGCVIAVFDSITDRKRAEEALRESEYFFRESQRAASVGSYKTDFITGFWESSQVLDQIFGIGRDYSRDVQGWMDIVHPDDREMMDRYLRDEVIAKRAPFDKEYRIKRKVDGEVRWVAGFGNTTFDADGKILSMIGTIQDITPRKHAEAETAKLATQLQQAQKMESVGRLAGGVAHDFNNMLGVILGHLEFALKDLNPSTSLYDDLTEIRAAATRSAALTRQLLAFARRQTVAPTVLNLNETVEAILTMLRRLIGENVTLLWRPSKKPWRIRVDPSQIDQILANLCVNARDAIAGVGTVTIEAGTATVDDADCTDHVGLRPGEYALLTVSDDGCGMDQETMAKVFEPFFTTKAQGKGTGLGLATVYGIVKQNDGFINVDSLPGRGTTFTIYLPRHVLEAGQGPTLRAVDTAGRGHETVLVVEDDPALLKMTTRMLAAQGYTVLAAGSPVAAIRVAGAYAAEIHLLMTDVVMPEMTGPDLATKLHSLYPHLKQLFTSGYTADIISHHGVLDEGVHFLQKPFSIHDLAAEVRKVLDES